MTDSPAAMLGPATRAATVRRLAEREYDVLVIGGGVTGAGVALDAATRGLSVALVEQRDWAAGTSSRSGKLIHGGLRYLEQFNLSLVREALRERALLLRRLCPHLVKPIRFVYPLRHRLWERVYIGAGLVLYDLLGGAGAVPRHRHLTRGGLRAIAPGVDQEHIVGALTFYDAQLDDARHTLELVRTAAAHGADVANRVRVVALAHDDAGRVCGADVHDGQSGDTFRVRARHVVTAAGVWSSRLDAQSGGTPGYEVQASKGVHIMVPRDRIDSTTSMFVRAEDSVLFVRTWRDHWLIGTTDTPYSDGLDDPRPTAEDIDYLLRNVNRVLRRPLGVDDVDAAYAGLRPLVVAPGGRTRRTSRVSREHTVETVAPGYTTIVGGKYTTYRVMAKDTVDAVVRELGVAAACRTAEVPLLGARDLDETTRTFAATDFGAALGEAQRARLLGRYGSLVHELAALVAAEPQLAEPLPGGEPYLAVEARYTVTHEDAADLEDVLARRTHVAVETSDRGRAAAPHVARIVAPVLGWDAARTAAELERYSEVVDAELAAERDAESPAELAEVRTEAS